MQTFSAVWVHILPWKDIVTRTMTTGRGLSKIEREILDEFPTLDHVRDHVWERLPELLSDPNGRVELWKLLNLTAVWAQAMHKRNQGATK